ncbi:aminoglycoside phosphotransferase [Stanieria cyanosphaera PCC 7437]|uniref:Aminoglycoside phosphotransferase n=1 Tax=Stanieria cyanosphaera (strain ATCC 29371 / PCC 7437) TaxID=111780 RepID=K9XVQ7_STAC7|nr:phosphotransferase [Stanieria cyanosphaera]AFZ35757.1 aminoglycoside phosphotransferase [Stanieria cyanosphaera PCC 7437]
MTFVLSSQNVFEYLIEQNLCTPEEQTQSDIEYKYAKNFNLLVSLADQRKLLVKQERLNREGKTAGEFLREWRIQEFLQQFPELNQMRFWLSEAIHFNPEHSIIVFNYLDNYRDLTDFYIKENIFPTAIAENLGTILANIHRLTLDCQDYQNFFAQNQENQSKEKAFSLVQELGRISPEIFSSVPSDGLKFFALYQRYDSLGKAIAELSSSLVPCCLTHNDLKLNNILLSNDWEQEIDKDIVRLIDWERSGWGDPAFDVGSLIGSYLHLWLISLITSKAISIDESLRMATTPLEQIQPSLAALAKAYLVNFPEIVEHRPDFWQRVIQFAGLSLIYVIQSTLQYQKSFGNTGICTLQVAKSLLCRPEASIPTIFGIEASYFMSTSLSPA